MERRRMLLDVEAKISEGRAKELGDEALKAKVKKEVRALTRQVKAQLARCERLRQLAVAYSCEMDYAWRAWQDGLVIHVKPTFNDPLEEAARKLGVEFATINEEVCDEVDG